MDAAHPTARRNWPIARWDHSGAERFWCDLAGVPQAIFPPNSSDRQMLNAVSEIGRATPSTKILEIATAGMIVDADSIPGRSRLTVR